jgi:hypothetical protein
LAEVQSEQVGLSLPRPSPSPPTNRSEWLRLPEGPLRSRRTRDRNRQPLVGTLARPRLGHLLRGAYDPRGRTPDRRPFLGSSRNDTQRTGAAGQRRLGERARRSKDCDRGNGSGLWRSIGTVGPVSCLALAHVSEGELFDPKRSGSYARPDSRARSFTTCATSPHKERAGAAATLGPHFCLYSPRIHPRYERRPPLAPS